MKKTKSILTKNQKSILDLFSKNKDLTDAFYLTGGTALNEFYIPYRYSGDLDFFSKEEIDMGLITTFLGSIRKGAGFKKFDINTSFNRNIVFLHFGAQILKLEFTYFPFPQIESPKTKNGLKIDGVLDIAVNKLFTIYQNPRSRDFMDLYMINKKYKYSMKQLIKMAKIKFDWHVDLIKLGSQYLLVKKLKDYPRLIEDIDHSKWQEFFMKESMKLNKDIFK